MDDIILIRYGEMTLKKKNYKIFLNKIEENIVAKLKAFSKLKFKKADYRFYIYLNGENASAVIDVLKTISGIGSFSLAKGVFCREPQNALAEIKEVALAMLREQIGNFPVKFKIETHRGDKSFPLTSIEVSQALAKMILPQIKGLIVDVHHPDLVLHVDLRVEGTFLYFNVIQGLGGFPSGMSGKALVMLSGGIDSPVATYYLLKKGVTVSAIHFASPPYTSDMVLQKVFDLLKKLAAYQIPQEIKLYVVPFTKIQTQIREKANACYMITLLRRAMYKIATLVAEKNGYAFLATGESIGQVASQTLASISVISNATSLPILRPLACLDKEEIIKCASAIGTYEISIRPYADCCTVFVPEHPAIHPRLDIILKEEEKCALDSEITAAFHNIYEYSVKTDSDLNIFHADLNI